MTRDESPSREAHEPENREVPQGTPGKVLRWAFALNWGQQGIAFLLTFVLAAILEPTSFGILAMAMVYVGFLQLLQEQGLTSSIVQRKELRALHLDSIFWVVLGGSLVLGLISIGMSHWWAAVNQLPELAQIITVLSVTLPLQALLMIPHAVLKRQLKFRELALGSNISALLGGIAGVSAALGGAGVWALVVQQLCNQVLQVTLLWPMSRWIPRIQFSGEACRELLAFSFLTFLAKVGLFLRNQSTVLLAGILLGPVAVGLYRLADRLRNTIMQLTLTPLYDVALPELSQLQDQPGLLRDNVLRRLRLSSLIIIPTMAAVAALSDPLTLALGPQWADASHVIKVLCAMGALQTVNASPGQVLVAKGRVRLLNMLVWSLASVHFVAILITAYAMRNDSVSTKVLAIASAQALVVLLVSTPASYACLRSVCPITIPQMARATGPALLSGALVVFSFMATVSTGLLSPLSPIPALALSVLIVGISAVLSLLILDGDLRARVLGNSRRITG
ncbi:MAG: lipopolysaccharide biosynthesis protein [Planctomycetota bacterium]